MYLEKTERFEVRVENRSAQALAAAREFRPDMMLLDVDMPGKDGGEVSHEMGEDPGLRGVPILFLTSLIARAEATEHDKMIGGRRFLAKPVNPKVLIDTIDRLLAGKVNAA
jgi:CheY-like chemotaxis protein